MRVPRSIPIGLAATFVALSAATAAASTDDDLRPMSCRYNNKVETVGGVAVYSDVIVTKRRNVVRIAGIFGDKVDRLGVSGSSSACQIFEHEAEAVAWGPIWAAMLCARPGPATQCVRVDWPEGTAASLP